MLSQFENLPPEAIELLEAAGHTEIKSIFEHSYEEVSQELTKANSVLAIVGEDLKDDTISEWLTEIETQSGKKFTRTPRTTSPQNPVIETPQTQAAKNKHSPQHTQDRQQTQTNLVSRADLQSAPIAIPLSQSFTKHHNLDLILLPQGTVHHPDDSAPSRIPAKQQSSTDNLTPKQTSTNLDRSSLYGNESTSARSIPTLDKSRILSMEEYQKEGSNVVQPVTPKQNNLTRTTRKETNEGVNPESKFYIKGVLHQDITKFKLASYSFLLFNLLIITAFTATIFAVIDREKYWWCVFAPALILPAIIIYFTSCQRASCPICTQKQYAPKRCLKHKNAHRWPILGYMLPTCLHALFFKWFRCIFCGTSVRLKE